MKSTSSLFLTLVSYLIMLATILFLLFAVMPPSLKAQTNAEMVATNNAVSNVTSTVVAENPKNAPAPSINIDGTGVHIGGANSGENKVPFIATLSATLALLIPIVGIVMGCSIPIIVVALALYFSHRKHKMLHETVRAMVEKGVPIPPELFNQAKNESPFADSAKRPRNDLRTGLIMTCLGVGIVLFIGKPGWIILFLGVAFLLIASFGKKNKNDDQPPKQ